ncbi:MAG: tRNA uracil 4-sulfurtransferase ThiI [Anaerolineae bacterium]
MGLVLLRYGEIALKGRNRPFFLRALRRNVRACLRAHDLKGTVTSRGQRVYVETEHVGEALGPLQRVFGVVSLSPVTSVAQDIDAIVRAGVEEAVAAGVRGGVSYRVQARRADKSFPLISPEINRVVGEAIYQATRGDVDLSRDADVTIGVEVHRDRALIYGRVLDGPGGLPLGTEGRVVALLSGGIDSPVAAWLMMRRGCGVVPLHLSQSESETAKTLANIDQLRRYAYGWELRPTILEHREVIAPALRALAEMREERWTCVICKHLMLRHAEALADRVGADAIVIGDSLGQVASQTLPNLRAVSLGIERPVLRPLIGLDKTEIVELGRRIGTFEISTRSRRACPFLPSNPITGGSVEAMRGLLDKLGPLAGEGDL